MGIQGLASSTVDDMGILAGMMAQDGIYLRALLEQDEWQRLELLRDGTLDLMYESSFLPARFEGRHAEDVTEQRGALPIRVVASAHSGSFGFMVRADSPIQTIYDIQPGTRVAVTPGGMGERIFALLAWLKLNDGPIQEDPARGGWKVEQVNCATWEENLRAVPEGRAEVAGVTPQNPLVARAAASSHGIRFLELPADRDPEGAQQFHAVAPQAMIAPAPEEGVSEIWGVSTITGIANVWCLPAFDEDLAWRLTRWFDENYPRFKDLGNKLKTYSLDCLVQAVRTAMAPIHPGTIRYLKEKNLWEAADDQRQSFNLWQEENYMGAWDRARSRAAASGTEISLDNPAWRNLWKETGQTFHLLPHRPYSDREIRALRPSG